MNPPIKAFPAKSATGRIAIAAAVLVTLLFCWFAIRWQIGTMFADLTAVNDPNAQAFADIGRSFAPSDPRPLWLAAGKKREDFSPEATEEAVSMMEDVVRLSPMDYRWWIELGRTYEQADQMDRAEAAFRQAAILAPEYTYPRWQFGNFLIRRGRTEDAFEQLKLATVKSSVYRDQVFSLAWDYFDKDPARVESLAADIPDVRANLAFFYAVRSASEDSLRMWNSLTEEKKQEHIATAKVIAKGLYDKGQYRQALEFAKQTGIDPTAEQETVTNAGFESSWGNPDDTLFGWRVMRSEGRVDINADTNVKREGNRSVKINFRSFDRPEYYNLAQVVTSRPGAKYRLIFFVRTESLTSAGMPLVQIWDPVTKAELGRSRPFPTGTNDWQQMSVEFTVPESSQGVEIRTIRDFCGEACPLVGILWYDEFRLDRL